MSWARRSACPSRRSKPRFAASTRRTLLLHPHVCRPWAVHPFAFSPGSCWVETATGGWWANCLYCAFGIAAALGEDALVATRLGGEREAVELRVSGGEVSEPDLLFHLATPVRHWWDNVIHACASFQPFRTEADIARWCERHGFGRGAVLPLPALWRFASDWYGDYLRIPWRKRTPEEARDLFERHGLTGDFWAI